MEKSDSNIESEGGTRNGKNDRGSHGGSGYRSSGVIGVKRWNG
ncbi:hypothetical protein [Pantoea coffeiphila]|nr:hypothetical protein [Pantoea coffeiphila]MBM7343165.1 hypothetical protein [Pantoea coffeiphila]